MAGPKEVFLVVAAIAVLVQAYFLLQISPGTIRLFDIKAKRHTSLKSDVMAPNIRHLEGLIRSSAQLMKMGPGIASVESRCSYKVQVYDRRGKLSRKPILQSVVQRSQGNQRLETNVTCGNNCQVQITIADDKTRFAKMDAVVFHFAKYMIPRPLPPPDLNPNQTWVYFSWESPRSNAREGVGRLPVHATWTYHRASEITTPYGFYIPGKPMTTRTNTVEEWLTGKTKLITWMASNCKGTFWPRLEFVKELKKHVPVDVYGACGNLTCRPLYSTKCTVDLVRKYKFYLSLENAECEDYITEKVWHKPLMQGVVPIVNGPKRKVYEELLPPNSFIYVGDYKNKNELAEHLKLLDAKPELYVRYLE